MNLRKKLTSFLAVVALLVADSYFDFGLDVETKRLIVIGLVGYMIGQGIADSGAVVPSRVRIRKVDEG